MIIVLSTIHKYLIIDLIEYVTKDNVQEQLLGVYMIVIGSCLGHSVA